MWQIKSLMVSLWGQQQYIQIIQLSNSSVSFCLYKFVTVASSPWENSPTNILALTLVNILSAALL